MVLVVSLSETHKETDSVIMHMHKKRDKIFLVQPPHKICPPGPPHVAKSAPLGASYTQNLTSLGQPLCRICPTWVTHVIVAKFTLPGATLMQIVPSSTMDVDDPKDHLDGQCQIKGH